MIPFLVFHVEEIFVVERILAMVEGHVFDPDECPSQITERICYLRDLYGIALLAQILKALQKPTWGAKAILKIAHWHC